MADGGADLSARARLRAAARQRRQARVRERGEILDLVVSGYTYEAIADSLKLSVKTVRRATAKAIEQRRLDCGAHYVHLQVLRLTKAMRVVDLNLDKGDLRAVARRRLDAGAHYVHLQVMRLTKALRVVDLNLDNGDLKAVAPMLKVVAQLDKYHALSLPAPGAASPPPLLTPARPPLALSAPEPAEIGTENGAQAVEIA